MSDTMLFGVLKMPYEMAMRDEMSRIQFYQRVQELVAIYTAPPQRPWIGLTDEEMNECNLDADELMISREVAKLNVQAKLKRKNHD
jgi:hypothetical protein